MDVKLNRVTFPDIEYVAIPKADGSGRALFRNIEFEPTISGTTITYDGETITYVSPTISGNTLVIPSGHINIQLQCDNTLNNYKTLFVS